MKYMTIHDDNEPSTETLSKRFKGSKGVHIIIESVLLGLSYNGVCVLAESSSLASQFTELVEAFPCPNTSDLVVRQPRRLQ
jgi:hypothetical protein